MKLVIDTNIVFVATALALEAKLWSGDKKLIAGLKKKGLDFAVQTEDLIS